MKTTKWLEYVVGCAGGLALGVSASCKRPIDTEDHCAVQDGDAYCAEKYMDGSRPYCARGLPGCEVEQLDGCVPARPVDDACYSPCGGEKSIDEDPECEGLADGSSSGGATEASGLPTTEPTGDPTTAGSMSASGGETEASSTTTSSGCTLSVECSDPGSPICVDMACVPRSSDEECMAKNPAAPACGDDGACVTCTPTNASACVGVTPVCNAVNECEGCDFHEQCPDSACRIATGACFDAAEVYDVGSGQTYASITAAVADLGEGGEVVLRIHDGPDYNGAVTIAGAGTAYAFLADDDSMVPQWINSMDAAPTLLVEDGAEVYVQSLRVTGNLNGANPGITADSATLYLDRTQVVGNTGGGMVLRSASHGYLRNCIVGGNGSGAGPSRGITVDAANIEILYSTIARNDADTDDDSLLCDDDSSVLVRNSILVGRDDPSVVCAGATIENSAIDQAVGGNVNVGPIQNTWFDNVAGNVFTLSAVGGGIFADIAQWQLGDPAVDIDGDSRPSEDGSPDIAGADLP